MLKTGNWIFVCCFFFCFSGFYKPNTTIRPLIKFIQNTDTICSINNEYFDSLILAYKLIESKNIKIEVWPIISNLEPKLNTSLLKRRVKKVKEKIELANNCKVGKIKIHNSLRFSSSFYVNDVCGFEYRIILIGDLKYR